jgi:hypothetical protein
MLTRLLSFLAAALLAAAVPAAAQSTESLAREMREMADSVSGVRVGTGAPADKVVFFGRDPEGHLLITGVAALAPGAPLEGVAEGAIAVLRTRASASPTPAAADLQLAQSANVPVFIVGEWRTPPVVWEIRRQEGGLAYREIDARGGAGAWTTPPR